MYEICHSLRSYNIAFTWEGLGAGGKGCDRGWDGWMASPTRWTWVWVNSGNWWWTGRPGVLQFIGSQRVGHDWVTELNWAGLQDFWTSLRSPNIIHSLISAAFPIAVLSSSKYASLVSSSKPLEPRLVISAKRSPPPRSLSWLSDYVIVVEWLRV